MEVIDGPSFDQWTVVSDSRWAAQDYRRIKEV